MPSRIHTLVQDPNNLDPGAGWTEKHQMPSGGVSEIPVTDIDFTAPSFARGEAFADIANVIRINISLIVSPGRGSIIPDIFDIGYCCG